MDLFEDTHMLSGVNPRPPNGGSAQDTIPVSEPGFLPAHCKARHACGLTIVRYYVDASASGEWPGRNPHEIGPNKVHTVTYPFDCDEDRIRFANAFIGWVSDARNESRFSDFGEFIKRDVVRHTTVDQLDMDDRSGATNTSALLFTVIKRAADFRKEYPIKDRRMCLDGSYRASVAVPIKTDTDKIRFAVGMAKGHFIDFMHAKTKVFLSSVVAFVDSEPPEAAGLAPQEDEGASGGEQEEEPDTDDDGIPQPDSDSDSDAEDRRDGDGEDRRALRAISDALFDEKEEIPEGVYLRLSQAMKRSRSE